MTEYPYILFNKTPEQMRYLGARGGKAYGRNQRARRALLPTPPQVVPVRANPQETAAKAIRSLNAQFPWLQGAEKQQHHEMNEDAIDLRLQGDSTPHRSATKLQGDDRGATVRISDLG